MLQALVNGILIGGVYAMIGLGFSLVWGVMNVINLTHGAFVILGAYITYFLSTQFGLDPFLTVPISAAAMFLGGYLLQKYVLNLIARAPVFMSLLLTYGLSILISNLAILAFTANVKAVTPVYADLSLHLSGLTVPVVRLANFGVAVLFAVGLMVLLDKTRVGRAIRATRMNLKAALLMGVRVDRIYATTFAIGAALAAAAGSLISMMYPFTPVAAGKWLAIAFVACTLGGLGHWAGALVGGVLLGVFETLGVSWFGVSYQTVVSLGLLLLVLLVRPRGILGKEYY